MEHCSDRHEPACRRVGFRWTICGLLFLAATINYVDRQVIGILKPTLQARIRLERDRLRRHRLRVPARLRDRLPVRRPRHGSARHQARVRARADHLVARRDGGRGGRRGSARRRRSFLGAFGLTYSASVAGFIFVRFVLGLGESGNFPAAIKTVAEWFPRRERAFATGALQRRHQHRRGDHADDRAVHHGALRLVLGVRPDRALGFGWLVAVAGRLRAARSASASQRRRSGRSSPAIRR